MAVTEQLIVYLYDYIVNSSMHERVCARPYITIYLFVKLKQFSSMFFNSLQQAVLNEIKCILQWTESISLYHLYLQMCIALLELKATASPDILVPTQL